MTDTATAHLAHLRSSLAAAFSQNIGKAIHEHRVYTETRAAQSVQNGDATGFIKIDGAGECIATIEFPIKFTKKPVFTAGLELAENLSLTWGGFPIWAATVGGWGTDRADGEPIYAKAVVGIVVFGVEGATLHYRFAAPSYTNPINADLSMNTPL